MKAIVLAALFAASACSANTSSGWELRTAASSSALPGRYRTYGFGLPEAPPSGYRLSPSLLDAEPRVRAFVADALERKGYVEDEIHPELIVRFGLGAMRLARVDSEENHSDAYLFEKIGFDLYDARANTELWHGSVEFTARQREVDDDTLGRAVRATLAPFPEPKMAAASSSAPPVAALGHIPVSAAP